MLVALLLASLPATAQKAVVEESRTDVVCISPTQAITHFRESTTILNERGTAHALFVCSCSKNDQLTRFKGQVVDATGRVLRKFKESELKRTEYSPYLAIDDYKMYLEYTPPVYPVTITYEWTVESRNNLIEFPRFCPLTDYDVEVRKATYRLTVPKGMDIRHALVNINEQVTTADDETTLTLELHDIPALQKEPFARPLRERLPMAFFAPKDFIYYGTKGCMDSWEEYGKWQYGLVNGREGLPEAFRKEIHQLTDRLATDREKVAALYGYLEKNTRYVAILLGIGGLMPASAESVVKTGYGDCKGLSNFMRAMLKEVGIPAHYTTISTTNRRLLPHFASVGQMDHVILQVPLPADTLYLECTNPRLPLGFLHDDIEGHNAIVVSERGGKYVRLPEYADTLNALRQHVSVGLSAGGSTDIKVSQTATYGEYERWLPLAMMDKQEVQRVLLQMTSAPQAVVSGYDISEDRERVTITLNADISSKGYASATGQRLFAPLCPIRKELAAAVGNKERTEDIFLAHGLLDECTVSIAIPEGYDVEAMPKDIAIQQPFGSFALHLSRQGKAIEATYRLLLKKGLYDKALYGQFSDFIKAVGKAYAQRVALKKQMFSS